MDNLTPEQRKKNMRNIRSKGTKPEKLIIRELRRRKIYFASHSHKIIGKPDFIFRRKRVVIFVDSDFWHGHPDRCVMPKSNTDYWIKKIERNRERDIQVNAELISQGWSVIRVWEHDIKKYFNLVIQKILVAIGIKE